ncbi:MAG TPA: hypothetical protein VF692_00375 [Pyrinomonadaceae bacterium]
MNLNISFKRFFAVFFAANFIFFGFSALEASAQTNKRAKRKQPIVRAAPLVEPEVVSRAGDSETEPRVFVQPSDLNQTAQPSGDEKAEKPNNPFSELSERVKNLESNSSKAYDDKQKRLMLNLDILTRAEQRAETLRKQLFDMIERESQIKTKLDQIENDIRPEVLERAVSFAGSLRPEELREMRRKNLDAERRNLQSLLTDIQNTRSSLTLNVQKADVLVEKMRTKLEKEIDDALTDEPKN